MKDQEPHGTANGDADQIVRARALTSQLEHFGWFELLLERVDANHASGERRELRSAQGSRDRL